MNDCELITTEQLADRLKVRPNTVRDWARRGRIPVVRLTAKVIRFEWHAVVAALTAPNPNGQPVAVDDQAGNPASGSNKAGGQRP